MCRLSEPFFRKSSESDVAELNASISRADWGDSEAPQCVSNERIDNLEHWLLFDRLETDEGGWIASDNLPSISESVSHLSVPLYYYLHGEVSVNGKTIEDSMVEFANDWLPGRKFLFSCDPLRYFAVEFFEFSYDHIDLGVRRCGEHTHFILFTEDRSKWISFYPLYPFTILSSSTGWPERFGNFGSTLDVQCLMKERHEAAFQEFTARNLDFFKEHYFPRVDSFPKERLT